MRRFRQGLLASLLALVLLPSPRGEAAAAENRPAVGSRDDANLVAVLIRSHLIALHQANISGNYSVLRDIGSDSFRRAFTAADLAAIFAPLRRQAIDLQAAAILQPSISGQPILDANSVMRMSGTFPTRPTAVHFEFAFTVEANVWKLAGLSVDPVQAVADLGVTRSLGYAIPTPRPQ